MALWRIRATVDDRPGYLSVLTASLALRSVNILAVQVHTTEGGAVDDFLIDAPDKLTESELLAAIAKGRGRDAFVSRAEAEGLVDQPTRVLALAGRLVHDPDALGEALVGLLDATEVRWRPDPPNSPPGSAACSGTRRSRRVRTRRSNFATVRVAARGMATRSTASRSSASSGPRWSISTRAWRSLSRPSRSASSVAGRSRTRD